MRRRKKKLKKKVRSFFGICIFILLITILLEGINYYMTINKELTPVFYHEEYFYAEDFGINVIKVLMTMTLMV